MRPSSDADSFRDAFRDHPAGVTIITADAGDGPVAMTATSLASVSVDPPLFMFSVSDLSSSAPVIRRADTIVAHLLNADDLRLAQLGATSGIDRFADGTIWRRLESGEPVFHEAHAWIRAEIVERWRAGTATVVVARALESTPAPHDESGIAQPLVYHNRAWHALGESSRIRE